MVYQEDVICNASLTDNALIDQLGEVLHWRIGPDRFLTANRSWLPGWKFNPLERLEDSFRLFDDCESICYILSRRGKFFQVKAQHGGKIGRAVGNSLPRTITLAVARSLVLLCYRRKVPQKGQQGSCRRRNRVIRMRRVAIERGLCRSARTRRAAGLQAGRNRGNA